ncbi:hypothetical protein mRhiFer1_009855 [Rhinolophus ferrumequinum]|uniref:Uncharacterized protein n=1 Tax=Rhinolophus ferrumequinum TaxID=59479 RepID=A0A7J7YTC7_RHIFE|nr:hypothetical protein mRhiFer1_009855 [Rhinolophus ferrumequinum]
MMTKPLIKYTVGKCLIQRFLFRFNLEVVLPSRSQNPAAQQRQVGAKLRAPCGLRGGCCGMAPELHVVPSPVRTSLLYFPPLAVCRRPETLVFRDCDGCVSEADRMPVSREGRWGKQDASIMLAQLGSRPPGDVMRCTASPGRRHRHLEDYIPTLKYTPTKQPSQTSNLAL